MKTVLACLLILAGAAGCCKPCLNSKPAGPKVEEYPAPPKPPERLHGGII